MKHPEKLLAAADQNGLRRYVENRIPHQVVATLEAGGKCEVCGVRRPDPADSCPGPPAKIGLDSGLPEPRTMRKRTTHSGPPSQITTPVSFRISNKLLKDLSRLAVVRHIAGRRVFMPAGPDASVTAQYKNVILEVLITEVVHRVRMNRDALPKTDPATQGFYYTELDYAADLYYAAPFTMTLDEVEAAKGIDFKTGKAIRLKPVAELDPPEPAPPEPGDPYLAADPASHDPADTASKNPADTATQPADTASTQPADTAVPTRARQRSRKTRRERRRDAKSKGLAGSE